MKHLTEAKEHCGCPFEPGVVFSSDDPEYYGEWMVIYRQPLSPTSKPLYHWVELVCLETNGWRKEGVHIWTFCDRLRPSKEKHERSS